MTKDGMIVAYSECVSAGIIRTQDLKSHYFTLTEWLTADMLPHTNMNVTFETKAGGVRNVRAILA